MQQLIGPFAATRSIAAESHKKNSSVPPRGNHIEAIGAFSAFLVFVCLTQKSHDEGITKKEIDALIMAGRLIVSVNGHVHDLTEFADSHPGGTDILWKTNGHEINSIWRKPEYLFHHTSDTVKEVLGQTVMGTYKDLPPLSHAKLFTDNAKFDPNEYIVHNQLNAEAKKPVFNENDETVTLFVREHGPYSDKQQDLAIEYDGKKISVNNDQLNLCPQKVQYQLVTCAGAGRSKFKEKVDGTSWGLGADAVNTMLVQGTNLHHLFDHLNVNVNEPCLIRVTGSDGYDTVVHSDEFNDFMLITKHANDKPLPELNGRGRRLMGKGVGFRQIKDVVSIEVIGVLPEKEISDILIRRLGEPMKELSPIVRQVLAASPSCDAYVQKDKEGKAVDFKLDVPISSIIHDVEHQPGNSEMVTISGVVYGSKRIQKVVVGIAGGDPELANLTRPFGSNQFARFEKIVEAKNIKSGDEVFANAVGEDSNPQPETVPFNKRGLWGNSAKATAPVP